MPHIVIRIFKAWNVPDADNQWVNNYEIMDFPSQPAIDNVGPLVNALVAAEQAIHLTEVYFTKAVVSTWQPDSKPYDPDTFVTMPLTVNGSRSHTAAAMERNIAYFVRKTPWSGRNGKFFYRGCLHQGDVQTTGSLKSRLNPASSLAAGGLDWQDYEAALEPYAGGSGLGDPRLALINQVAPGVVLARPIASLAPAGVVVNRSNHKYFDRAA